MLLRSRRAAIFVLVLALSFSSSTGPALGQGTPAASEELKITLLPETAGSVQLRRWTKTLNRAEYSRSVNGSYIDVDRYSYCFVGTGCFDHRRRGFVSFSLSKIPSKAIVTGATLELTRLDFKQTNNTVRLTGAKWGGRFVNPDDTQFVYIIDSSLYSAISLGQTYHWWADPSKKTWTLNSTAVKDLQWGPGHQDRFTIGIDTTQNFETADHSQPWVRYAGYRDANPPKLVVTYRLDETPPSVPRGLTAIAGSLTRVDLSWDSSTGGATGYKVYRDGVLRKSVTGTTTSDSGLNAPGRYCYSVSALDSVSNESAKSGQACVDTRVPALKVTAVGDGQVKLSWDSASEATSYNIYWSTSQGVSKATGDKISGVASPHTHTGLTGGTTYYYVLTMETGDGESNESNEVSATPVKREITRVSVSSSGDQADSSSSSPSISADGRFVAFSTSATNLVPEDTTATGDVFIHDRLTGTTSRVSVSSTEDQGNHGSYGPSVSADGRFVAFPSSGSNLVAGDISKGTDIFVHDRVTGETTMVSVSSTGDHANERSDNPAISADGRFVAFNSFATNLVPGDTNKREDVFVHDRITGQTTRVSVSSGGGQGNFPSQRPSISADGRFVAFDSFASDLLPGYDKGGGIYVHDRETGEITVVS